MPWQFPLFLEHEERSVVFNPGALPVSNVTDANCSEGVQFIYKVLGDCVTDTKGILSDAFGIASIAFWIIVSVPQMIKNCRNIRGVEGVSLGLILQWTLGDTTNLVGSILTKQLILQIYLAVYFVFADLVLFSQYIFYQIWKRKHKKDMKTTLEREERAPSTVVLCFTGAMLTLNLFGIFFGRPSSLIKLSPDQDLHISHHAAGRNLLSTRRLGHIQVFNNFKDEVGYAIGIVSSLFYIGSRSSQLYKNYKRKSTEGLSLLMFWLAILGNLTYGLSILVRQLDAVFVIRHIPWLVGSLGVILLDASLVVQFKYYGSTDSLEEISRRPLLESEIDVDNSDVPINHSVNSVGNSSNPRTLNF